MTDLLTAHIGSYPRIGDHKDQQRHRRARGHFESGELSAHALRDVEQSVVQEVIHEQIGAGLDEVTDGLVTWQDPISPFCLPSGASAGPLRRFLHDDFYYRQPVFSSVPKKRLTNAVAEYRYAAGLSPKPVRPLVTGPATLASHTASTHKGFDKLAARLAFFTELIAQTVGELAAAGAKTIQVNEPALAYDDALLKGFPKIWPVIRAQAKDATVVLSCPSASGPALAALWDVADALHFAVSPVTPQALPKAGGPATVCLGVIDATTTALEVPATQAAIVDAVLAGRNAARVYLTPSDGLERLPRTVALEKLKLLPQIKDAIGGARKHASR